MTVSKALEHIEMLLGEAQTEGDYNRIEVIQKELLRMTAEIGHKQSEIDQLQEDRDSAWRHAKLMARKVDHKKVEIEQLTKERDDLLYCNEFVGKRVERAESSLDAIKSFIHAQAEDDGLWCEAECVSEAYIQKGLRGCHAFVESVIKDGPRPETTKNTERPGGHGDHCHADAELIDGEYGKVCPVCMGLIEPYESLPDKGYPGVVDDRHVKGCVYRYGASTGSKPCCGCPGFPKDPLTDKDPHGKG